MKITDNLGNRTNMIDPGQSINIKPAEQGSTSFIRQMHLTEQSALDGRLSALVEEISNQGKKLGKKVDIRELKMYKGMISDFFNEIAGNTHRFSKESFIDRRGRHRVYALIRQVNEQLDELTKEVLSDEGEHINILQRIEDIRGLLLDILM